MIYNYYNYGLWWFIIDYYRSKYYILIDYYHLWLLYSFLQFVRSLLCLKISPAHTGTYRHQFRHVPTSTAAPFVLRSTPRQWVPAKPKGLAREDQVESSCESFWKTDISPCQIVCIIYIYIYIMYILYIYIHKHMYMISQWLNDLILPWILPSSTMIYQE